MRIHIALALAAVPLALSGCLHDGGDQTLGLTPETLDTIVMSDQLFYLNGQMLRAESECGGDACSLTAGEETTTVTADETWFLSVHADPPATGIIQRHGVNIARLERDDIPVEGFPELTATGHGYGAWARYVAFDATIVAVEAPFGLYNQAGASVGGIGSQGNPVEGTGEWSGAMVAIDYRDIAARRFLAGDAHVRVDFAELDVDVALSEIANVESGETYDDMTWEAIALRDGVFETSTLAGRFFGPSHEEVGGVFDRNSIIGSFGATRD